MEITKPEDWTNYYFPTWLPEGYDLEQHNGVEGYRTIRFSNGTTAISMYEIKGETGFDSVIDTEDAISDYLLINNYDAIYVFKNETSTIAWLEGDTLIKLIGPIKKAEIMKIAKNIKIIN